MDIGETDVDSRVRWAYFVARKAEGRALWCYLSSTLDLEHRIQRIKVERATIICVDSKAKQTLSLSDYN